MTDRVLVTGATGFIGVPVLTALASCNAEVFAVGRPSGAKGSSSVHGCDLLDRDQRVQLIDEISPTHLVHLAWTTEHGEFWTDPDNDRWHEASVDLLEKFRANGGRRAVLVGSCAEYDWSRPGPHAESSQGVPASTYGASKLATANAAMALGEATSLSVAWARLFHLYGPNEHPSRLVPSLIRTAQQGREPVVRHPGNVIDLLHVADVATALCMLLHSTVEGPVNVASGVPTSLSLLSSTVASLGDIPTTAIGVNHDVGDVVTADVTRIRTEVGFRPRFDLSSGLSSAWDWWLGNVRTEETTR